MTETLIAAPGPTFGPEEGWIPDLYHMKNLNVLSSQTMNKEDTYPSRVFLERRFGGWSLG